MTCLPPDSLLAEPVPVLHLDLRWVQKEEVSELLTTFVVIAELRKKSCQVENVEDRKFVSVTREGRLHGLALWFDATFNPMLYDEDEAAKIQKVLLS